MNWGLTIKKLRKERDITQGELSRRSGVGRSYLSRIEMGLHPSHNEELLGKLATGLNLTIPALLEKIYGRPKDSIGLVKLPLIGSIPCGTPFPALERADSYIYVPESYLGGVKTDSVYCLRVSGMSLEADGVMDGDVLIIDPKQTNLVNGKVYIVEIPGEGFCARHVYIRDGILELVSSDSKTKTLKPSECIIKGKVHKGFREINFR